MPRKLRNTTFTLTENQITWLKEQSEKTGLTQVEVVRRAIDAYAEAEEAKEQRRFFTHAQRREIKIIARQQGISELDVIQKTIDRGLQRITETPRTISEIVGE